MSIESGRPKPDDGVMPPAYSALLSEEERAAWNALPLQARNERIQQAGGEQGTQYVQIAMEILLGVEGLMIITTQLNRALK